MASANGNSRGSRIRRKIDLHRHCGGRLPIARAEIPSRQRRQNRSRRTGRRHEPVPPSLHGEGRDRWNPSRNSPARRFARNGTRHSSRRRRCPDRKHGVDRRFPGSLEPCRAARPGAQAWRVPDRLRAARPSTGTRDLSSRGNRTGRAGRRTGRRRRDRKPRA